MKQFSQPGTDWETRCRKGRIVLVDDDPHVLEGLGGLLALEGYACEGYLTVAEALGALHADAAAQKKQGPVCILSDVRMPEEGGLELQQQLAGRLGMPIVLMSGAATPGDVVRAFRAGAVDFLLKPIDAELLLDTMARALALGHSLKQDADSLAGDLERLSRLTRRELEVAQRVSRGELNREIADALGIALRTVKHHRAVAMEKLGLDSAVDLARLLDRSAG